jgi:hypothetical protein
MSDQMLVVFVQETGHVLGALTRTADAGSKLTPQAAAGAGLVVHGPKELLVVAADFLAVLVAKYDAQVVRSPRQFAAGGAVVAQLDVSRQATVPATGLTTAKITINAATAGIEKLKVWAQVEEAAPPPGREPERRVMKGEIPAGMTTVTLDLKLQPDGPVASIPQVATAPKKDYFVLALVSGHLPYVGTHTPP